MSKMHGDEVKLIYTFEIFFFFFLPFFLMYDP